MSNDKKPDFSNVQSGFRTTEQELPPKPDFSNVQSGFSTTEEVIGQSEPAAQTYTVEKGDSLSKISRQFYGEASRWREIFEANRDQLDDPDRIFPGQVLKIPQDGSDGPPDAA